MQPPANIKNTLFSIFFYIVRNIIIANFLEMLRRNIEAISPTRNSEQYQTYKYTAWAGLKKQKQKNNNNNKTTKERVEGLTL